MKIARRIGILRAQLNKIESTKVEGKIEGRDKSWFDVPHLRNESEKLQK